MISLLNYPLYTNSYKNMDENASKICRICLEKVYKNTEIFGNLTAKMLEILPAQINTSISRNPVICQCCSEKLQKSFQFKTTCLTQDDCLKTFLFGITKVINLREIIARNTATETYFNKSVDDVCRFCLKYCPIECSTPLHNTQDWFLKDMIDRCFPEINLSISLDPLVCNVCRESLQHQFNFMVQCCDAEELIQNYMTFASVSSGTQIDLHSVYEYALKTKQDYQNGVDIIKKENEVDDEFVEEVGLNLGGGKGGDNTGRTYKGYEFTMALGPKHQTTAKFSCSQCPYKSYRRDYLISHLLVHENNKTFKCELCNFQTKWRTSLMAHTLRHKKLSDVTMYKCNNCTYQSKYKKHLRRHMLTHMSVFLTCASCGLRTKRKHQCDKLKAEVKTEPEGGQPGVETRLDLVPEGFSKVAEPLKQCWLFKCNSCSYETKKSHRMKEHVVKHLGNDAVEMFKCDRCDFKSKYKSSLRHHVKQLHQRGGGEES